MSHTAEILRVSPETSPPAEWESKIDLIRRTVASGATADELDLFFYQARRAGLDPLAKQIYYVKRQGKGTVQVGIDGLRLIADRTGQYAGSDDATFGATNERGFPSSASVVVYKMVGGVRCPFGATARWDEYFPGDAQGFQWKRMPHAMLAKCAEALALRKGFPADMSGLYINEEMDQAGNADAILAESVDLTHTVTPEEEAHAKKQEPEPEAKKGPAQAVAFGYSPKQWPVERSWSDKPTESQAKHAKELAETRRVGGPLLPLLSNAICEAYKVENGSKASAALIIDWLKNADDDALSHAIAFLDKPKEAQLG